jgi:hypothetical protein
MTFLSIPNVLEQCNHMVIDILRNLLDILTKSLDIAVAQ